MFLLHCNSYLVQVPYRDAVEEHEADSFLDLLVDRNNFLLPFSVNRYELNTLERLLL